MAHVHGGALNFEADIDIKKLTAKVALIESQIGKLSHNVQKHSSHIMAMWKHMIIMAGTMFAVQGISNFITKVASVRGEFQQLQVAFETMLGSKIAADKMMQDVVEFAKKTPFEIGEVASGTKQLLAYGIESQKIIPTLKSLGDVAAALSVPMERLILNYGQVRVQGKLTGRELRDFSIAGVPLVAELAKQLNRAESEIAG